MVVVGSVAVAVIVVVKMMLCFEGIIDMEVKVEVDVECIVVTAILVPLKLDSGDVPSCMVVDLSMEALVAVILTGIGTKVLIDVNADAFGVLDDLKFPVRTMLAVLHRCAAFDCRTRALLCCDRVVQLWIPAYHV